ncbi:MAG TPA: CDP-alcohol phosphatidyltransferase family protein [Candidatus Angelobacter sp.]|nr:CDP-alcohol phosphatidyltransferase family protein [Candidatus Angelobacter sp.]
METTARRPLKTRQAAWAGALARLLVRSGVSPNAISITSVFFALGGAAGLYYSADSNGGERILLLLLSVAGIQGRLLCNMLDGMVAIEGGRQTKSGEIFNDLPDRIADAVIFIAAGYAARQHAFGIELGYIAAVLAVFTAYVRMLGGASGLKQSFIGPMAKQHRMALLSAGCVISMFESRFFETGTVVWAALIVVNLGCLLTIGRRTARIARELESR